MSGDKSALFMFTLEKKELNKKISTTSPHYKPSEPILTMRTMQNFQVYFPIKDVKDVNTVQLYRASETPMDFENHKDNHMTPNFLCSNWYDRQNPRQE